MPKTKKKPAKKKIVRKIGAKKSARKAAPKKKVVKVPAARKGAALTRIEHYLADNKVRYGLIRHAVAFTAQQIAAAEHISGHKHVKVVVVKSNSNHYLAALPAAARVDFKKLSSIIGKSVSLAKESDLAKLFPDCALGAMPPLGSLYNLPLFVERSLAQNTEIVFQGGTHTDALKVSYNDFEKLEKPKLADFAQTQW